VTICSWVFAGKVSFNRRSLHAIGNETNPYEQALNIIGQTLSPFDEDNLIPCFGFGDGASSSLEQLETLSIQSESLKHFLFKNGLCILQAADSCGCILVMVTLLLVVIYTAVRRKAAHKLCNLQEFELVLFHKDKRIKLLLN
jgi:hypothetical protein